MDETAISLTVFFEEPFWVGVFERMADGCLSACKITFGAEPKDWEVYDFINQEYCKLAFSPAVEAQLKVDPGGYKRMQRNIKRQLQTAGVGTKSQQALQLQREAMKTARIQNSKEQREAEKQRLFERKRQKRKEKHRGR